jgi:predicted nucleic acid-binding protein
MRLVADAGPLIALAKLDRLDVLKSLATETWLPTQVMYEVLAKPGVDAQRVQRALDTWLKVGTPSMASLPDELLPRAVGLGRGNGR